VTKQMQASTLGPIRFIRNFEYLRGLAMPPAESLSLIREVARTMAA
jgi:hypothetical protein